MIREPGPAGTVTLLRSETGGWAGGTVSVDVQSQPAAADGTVTLDRAALMAFRPSERIRWGKAIVRLNGEELAGIRGTVQVDDKLEAAAPTASFSVTDSRACMYDPLSFTWGEQPVSIDWRSGRPGKAETVRRFEGIVEQASTEAAYVNRGSFRCVGNVAATMAKVGCLRVPAFSGKRRGAILADYALACGVTLTNDAVVRQIGKVVTKKTEINGVALWTVAQRIGELEGMIPRAHVDGTVEMLVWADLLTTPPLIDFGPGYSFLTPSEQPPSKPITQWTLSAEVVEPIPPGAVTVKTPSDDGNTVIRVTTDEGVEILREEDTFAVFATGGVTTGPEMRQLQKRTRTESIYEKATFLDGLEHWTTQLLAQTISVFEVFSPIASTGVGYEWADDAGWHVDAAATFRLGQKTTISNNWRPQDDPTAPCRLNYSRMETWDYYSGAIATSDTGSGYAYGDGTRRRDDRYVWQQRALQISYWSPVFFVETDKRTEYWGWAKGRPYGSAFDGREEYGWYATDRERWWDIAAGTRYAHRITRYHQESLPTFPLVLAEGETMVQILIDEEVDGLVPDAPSGSVDAAQFTTRVINHVFEPPVDSPFRVVPGSDTLEFAEDDDDLVTVERWRSASALADRVTIPTRLIPFLSCGDVVSATQPGLQLAAAVAIVEALTESHDVGTFKGRMTPTLRLLS